MKSCLNIGCNNKPLFGLRGFCQRCYRLWWEKNIKPNLRELKDKAEGVQGFYRE